MSQHDMDLANAAGASFRTDANAALVALVGLSSGATEPGTTFAYMWWADTATGLLKQRNAANSGWLTKGTLASGVTGTGDTVLATSPTLVTPKSSTTIGVGNATAAASGAGITFPATQSASSDANTLDDYEEGSWTPTDISGGSLSLTVVADGCTYIKQGQEVTLFYDFTFPATADANNANIGGLPFTSFSSTNRVGGGVPSLTDAGAVSFAVTGGGTNFFVHANTGGNKTNANLSSNTFRGVLTYRANA